MTIHIFFLSLDNYYYGKDTHTHTLGLFVPMSCSHPILFCFVFFYLLINRFFMYKKNETKIDHIYRRKKKKKKTKQNNHMKLEKQKIETLFMMMMIETFQREKNVKPNRSSSSSSND